MIGVSSITVLNARTTKETARGDVVPDWDGEVDKAVISRCEIQPSSSDETNSADGDSSSTTWQVFGPYRKDIPASAASRILWLGREFAIVGTPLRRMDGTHIDHVEMTIRERSL